MTAADITTAVDSLVRLVQKRGMISVDDISKELGIPSTVVNEWAVFLEEEGIIGIEYKFTTPYLFYKRQTITYGKEKDLIKKKLNLLLVSVQGKEPKTKKGEMQKDFLIDSINNLIQKVDYVTPSNKTHLIENIKRTMHRKVLFDQYIRSEKS